MLRKFGLVVALTAICVTTPSAARNDRKSYPIRPAISSHTSTERLDPKVRLYFGQQRHAGIAKDLGATQAYKKGSGPTDQAACEAALRNALIQLQFQAISLGGDAVVGISSTHQKDRMTSETEFICGAGSFSASVIVTGQIVKLGAR